MQISQALDSLSGNWNQVNLDEIVPLLIKCMRIDTVVYCCVLKSRTCTDFDKKKEIYDIVLAIIDAIESSKSSKPQGNPQTSVEKFKELVGLMIGRFD